MSEDQEKKTKSSTRGGWQLYDLLGLSEGIEKALVNEITIAVDATQDDEGGKKVLEKLMPVVEQHPIDEAIEILMFFGRWIGHIEYEKNQRQQGGLAELIAKLGGDAKVMVVGPGGAKLVKASDLKEAGGEY
jgi:hypothetical protein